MTGAEGTVQELARWAAAIEPSDDDLALARVALVDTLTVAQAAVDDPLVGLFELLGPAGRLAALSHLLDYDDLHVPSTSHVSAMCVPVALACEGGPEAYLAGAGVMARLGMLLGWDHYAAGWHITCTAGAPAAAVVAARARGLEADGIARAIALALPAAGGVQRAFGTTAKPLQVGFAADAGVRAAELAVAGATADLRALDEWLVLVGAGGGLDDESETIPGGLATKLFPCCYALQRPIDAVRQAAGEPLGVERVDRVSLRLPADVLQPLIHSCPRTGLEAKFSLHYAVAATLLDGWPGLSSFADAAVARPEACSLLGRVAVETVPGGGGLLAGEVEVELRLRGGERRAATVAVPPGAPGQPLGEEEFRRKVTDCVGLQAEDILAQDWTDGPALGADRSGAMR